MDGQSPANQAKRYARSGVLRADLPLTHAGKGKLDHPARWAAVKNAVCGQRRNTRNGSGARLVLLRGRAISVQHNAEVAFRAVPERCPGGCQS